MQNYLLYGNASLPGTRTRLSFGNLHSLRVIGLWRGPGKTHARAITTSERELSCGDGMACLRLPSSPCSWRRPAWCSRASRCTHHRCSWPRSNRARTRLPESRAIQEGPRLQGAAWQETRGISRPKAKFGELGITRAAKKRKVGFPAPGSCGTV